MAISKEWKARLYISLPLCIVTLLVTSFWHLPAAVAATIGWIFGRVAYWDELKMRGKLRTENLYREKFLRSDK